MTAHELNRKLSAWFRKTKVDPKAWGEAHFGQRYFVASLRSRVERKINDGTVKRVLRLIGEEPHNKHTTH